MIERILDYIIHALVKHQEDVVIKKEIVRGRTILKIFVNKEDLGKVIGRNRMTLNAIRAVCNAFSDPHNHPQITIVRDYEGDNTVAVDANELVDSSDLNKTPEKDSFLGLENQIETI